MSVNRSNKPTKTTKTAALNEKLERQRIKAIGIRERNKGTDIVFNEMDIKEYLKNLRSD